MLVPAVTIAQCIWYSGCGSCAALRPCLAPFEDSQMVDVAILHLA